VPNSSRWVHAGESPGHGRTSNRSLSKIFTAAAVWQIADICFGPRAGRLNFKPESYILWRAVLADISASVLLAAMFLNSALGLFKAVDIKKRSPEPWRLQFLQQEVVGVSTACIFAATTATAPMETESIRAIDFFGNSFTV